MPASDNCVIFSAKPFIFLSITKIKQAIDVINSLAETSNPN